MRITATFLFLAATVLLHAKPYEIPEAKVTIALPDKGWSITRENQPSGPLTIRTLFVADKSKATITVASVRGGPVTDDSLADFAEGMKMFFGPGSEVSEEKTEFSGLKAIRLKGVANVQGTSRDQELLAYLIGETGWVIVCGASVGDKAALTAALKLVTERK